MEAMTLYARCRRFGGEQIQWPFDPSWANNPAIIVDVIDAILQEEAALRASAFEDTD